MALGVVLIGSLIVLIIIGPTGALAYYEYHKKIDTVEAELAQLKEDKAALKNRVELLSPDHADPDLVDELLRRNLNVAHPDDLVVPRL